MNLADLKFEYGLLPNQVTEALFVLAPRDPAPCAHIFYRQILRSTVVEILYIFVHERYRRRGIATRMLAELQRWYPDTIVSTDGGNEHSTDWLKVCGFVEEPNGWFLRPYKSRPLESEYHI